MKLRMISADDIMIIVVSLLVFVVGCYAAFTTLSNIPVYVGTHGTTAQNATYKAVNNATTVATNVFNVVGIVLVIGAILVIVGIVYSYIKPRY